MRHANRLAADILMHVGPFVQPGVTTDRLDMIVHDKTIELGGYPSPLGYRGFPKSVCTSINEVICHGIPDSRPLINGDIVNVDVTIYIDGVHGDTSMTFIVGETDEWSQVLVHETKVSLDKAIEAIKPGLPLNVIGLAIETHARKFNLGVVREFIGHGIGPEFHGSMQIPHYFDPRVAHHHATGHDVHGRAHAHARSCRSRRVGRRLDRGHPRRPAQRAVRAHPPHHRDRLRCAHDRERWSGTGRCVHRGTGAVEPLSSASYSWLLELESVDARHVAFEDLVALVGRHVV